MKDQYFEASLSMRAMSAQERRLALRFADVALPAYAIDCEPWEFTEGVWIRLFTVKEWQIGAVVIAVAGEQTHLGEVACRLYVGGEERFEDADRQALTTAILEAGKLLDELR